jgi:hypothetical protein
MRMTRKDLVEAFHEANFPHQDPLADEEEAEAIGTEAFDLMKQAIPKCFEVMEGTGEKDKSLEYLREAWLEYPKYNLGWVVTLSKGLLQCLLKEEARARGDE